MALLFGYLFDSRAWMRVVLLCAAIPIAICANGVRVALAGAVPAFAEGKLHELSGAVIFALCLASLMVFKQGVQRLFHKPEETSHA
jgi:exosortase/archaeosortase family protein